MEDFINRTQNIFSLGREYLDNQVNSVKLSVAEKGSGLMANLMAIILVIAVALMALTFAGIALALLLSHLLGGLAVGFLIVAGLYVVLAIIMWTGRERLLRIPIINGILGLLYKNDEADQEYKRN